MEPYIEQQANGQPPRMKMHNANVETINCSELPYLLIQVTVEEIRQQEARGGGWWNDNTHELRDWWRTLASLSLTSKAFHDAAHVHLLERAASEYIASFLDMAEAHYWDGNPYNVSANGVFYVKPYGVKWEQEWEAADSTLQWLRSLPKSTSGVPIGADDFADPWSTDHTGFLDPFDNFWMSDYWWPLDWSSEDEAYEAYETIESAIVSMDISALYKASRLMKEAERGARKKRETEWDAKKDHDIWG